MKKYIMYGVGAFIVGFGAVLIGNAPISYLTTEKSVSAVVDTLPLKNQGTVVLEVENGVKYVYMSLDDFEYVVKKKSVSKKVVKSLNALFARLEG